MCIYSLYTASRLNFSIERVDVSCLLENNTEKKNLNLLIEKYKSKLVIILRNYCGV